MENNKNKQETTETTTALADDALGEVTGGSNPAFTDAPAPSYKEASDVMTPVIPSWMKEYDDYRKKP